ncbi:MAG: helix-turn-helix domain-containing protein [Pseudomonadota bacterium]
MSKHFALDLKVARRKSGLTQSDCAHLLNAHRTKIGHIERGRFDPSAKDIAYLSLIFGKSYDALCRSIFENAADQLSDRLATLPTPKTKWIARFNRTNTIDKLDARLSAITKRKDGGA